MVFKTNITYRTKIDIDRDRTFKSKIEQWQGGILNKLTQIPPKPSYPITTKMTKRQRGWFWANFKDKVPTKRTNKVAEWDVFVDYDGIDHIWSFSERLLAIVATLDPRGKAPQLQADPNGILVNITNPAPYQRFVTGVDQQGFHADTGWIYAPDIITRGVNELDSIVSDGVL